MFMAAATAAAAGVRGRRKEDELSLGVMMTNTEIFHIFQIFSLFKSYGRKVS
jgi:hypothetical protein